MFRSRDGGSFWRPNTVVGSATFDDEEDDVDNAARAGARAVERAINGPSMAATPPAESAAGAQAVVTGVEVNGRSSAGEGSAPQIDGGDGVDASERGEGGSGGGGGDGEGSGANREGRILFYHKPTLANVPAGDVPDVVPVYLGCPRGNMALGLPLDEAWQGEEHQVSGRFAMDWWMPVFMKNIQHHGRKRFCLAICFRSPAPLGVEVDCASFSMEIAWLRKVVQTLVVLTADIGMGCASCR